MNVARKHSCLIIVLMLGLKGAAAQSTGPEREGTACSLSSRECSALSSLLLAGNLTFTDTAFAGKDFGKLEFLNPAAVLYPGSVNDIASVIVAAGATGSNMTVAARGPGHSTHGQSQARNGVVLEMSAIKGIVVNAAEMFVEAAAGELWVDVLRETLRHGLSPRSFTDYLRLSVGGTLSNAGVSGQAYRWGPQLSNVLSLEVVSGTGELVICSEKVNSRLFFAVLGGLGQFGVITKAKIRLQPAPIKVRWIRALYADFAAFKRDQEYLVSQADSADPFDYVEGFVVSNTPSTDFGYNSVPFSGTGQAVNPDLLPYSASSPVLYYVELVKHYNDSESSEALDQRVADLLGPLQYISTQIFSIDASYFDFLDRVYTVELLLSSIGRWDVPHPWLNLLVPASQITNFDYAVFKSSAGLETTDAGPVIVYALNRNKWDDRMSAIVPDEEVFYLVGLLSSASTSPESGPSVSTLLARNRDLEEYCQKLGCKVYFPTYCTPADWRTHFGSKWDRFVENKLEFDPQAILAPAQNIFPRSRVPQVAGLNSPGLS